MRSGNTSRFGAYQLDVIGAHRMLFAAALMFAVVSGGSMSPAAPAEAGPPHPVPSEGRADQNPDNDLVVAPPDEIADCQAKLMRAKVRYRAAELPVRETRGAVCGAEQVVVYQRGPRSIRYNSAPLVTCGMALALARFEEVVTAEALSKFNQRVVAIEQGGTYSCRKMARFSSMVSEHSYANAIDIRSFRLENGRVISVLRHFDAPAGRPQGEFLRTLARRLYDEDVFSVVLTVRFDRLHRDHFHLDLARYRVDGTR
jgi:hypothetical protein